jgi:hypothetical protein
METRTITTMPTLNVVVPFIPSTRARTMTRESVFRVNSEVLETTSLLNSEFFNRNI